MLSRKLYQSLSTPVLEQLTNDANMYATGHGLALSTGTVPVSLFPSALPRSNFEHAYKLTPTFQKVLASASRDFDWIAESLKDSRDDPLIGPMLEMAERTAKSGSPSVGALTITRNDYMVHAPTNTLQQIEINTIACAFAALAPRVRGLHDFTLRRAGFEHLLADLPENKSAQEIPAALASAHRLYGRDDAVIVMVVQPDEKNTMDQWFIEYELLTVHGIKLLRRSLKDIAERGITNPDQSLSIDGKEAAVFYFRSGYAPEHYPSKTEWEGRSKIEFSRAVSCPNVTWHLLTSKKIQQVLATPASLERLATKEDASVVSSVFTGIWPAEDTDIAAKVFQNPSSYVLKPQREGGGGNNLYGEDAASALKKMSEHEKQQWILMQLVEPPLIPNYLIRKAERIPGDLICELGIFGHHLSQGSSVLANEVSGHLVRSKFAGTLDGGVAAGIAMLDSPILYDGEF